LWDGCTSALHLLLVSLLQLLLLHLQHLLLLRLALHCAHIVLHGAHVPGGCGILGSHHRLLLHLLDFGHLQLSCHLLLLSCHAHGSCRLHGIHTHRIRSWLLHGHGGRQPGRPCWKSRQHGSYWGCGCGRPAHLQ
jgi:hypothetical protein